MLDEKDLEIARLKGQIEALEKQVARLSPVPFTWPTFVPAPMLPYQPPTVVHPPLQWRPQPSTWEFLPRTTCNNGIPLAANAAGCCPNLGTVVVTSAWETQPH